MGSPFLHIPPTAHVTSNAHAFAIPDLHPVSPGHTLVIPHRPVLTYFDATAEEKAALWQLVDEVRALLDRTLTPRPDGYNVGFNAGEAAGQTVPHLHIHVIPRYRGDTPDPRGGVRHVIPGRGNYLSTRAPALATGGPEDPFARHLWPLFATARDIAIVAAFVMDGGCPTRSSGRSRPSASRPGARSAAAAPARSASRPMPWPAPRPPSTPSSLGSDPGVGSSATARAAGSSNAPTAGNGSTAARAGSGRGS